ncbi:hypothetical protein CRG98_014122 [Punica granatum]|uniref:Uncharacterized protein n=1 Tax=Punica granatum TaxID=22663 RepID=A0A2I0KAB5_PUNGR|nr:hypothetical protein CRG98_014122 [Punica granatum]
MGPTRKKEKGVLQNHGTSLKKGEGSFVESWDRPVRGRRELQKNAGNVDARTCAGVPRRCSPRGADSSKVGTTAGMKLLCQWSALPLGQCRLRRWSGCVICWRSILPLGRLFDGDRRLVMRDSSSGEKRLRILRDRESELAVVLAFTCLRQVFKLVRDAPVG